jgi:hypothetical protein
MAQDNDNEILDRMPRKKAIHTEKVVMSCHRCNERLVIKLGDMRRCLCGGLQAEWPEHGGLGARATHYPARQQKRGLRA